MDGIFLLDKWKDISSNHALQKVKRLFQTKKAGHAGTLDPLATGMLPIALGEATKFLPYVLTADKTYLVTMQLGVRTNTSDSEGEIIETRAVPALSLEDIDQAFASFRGDILQIPTMFSALKYNGIPLYDYARKGITVPREPRPIHIYNIRVLVVRDAFVDFTVHCSTGTYVRTLVDDVGEKLGCGAHVTALRRLSVGRFQEKEMVTFDALQQSDNPAQYLLPMDAGIDYLPILKLSPDHVFALQQGKVLQGYDHVMPGLFRLYGENNVFYGVVEKTAVCTIVSKRLLTMCKVD